jgi:protein-disulfide isomerase
VALYMLARNLSLSWASMRIRRDAAGRPDMTRLSHHARPNLTRRETLRTLGAGAAILGLGIAPGPALAESNEDTVLTEALVLRDPDIPVAGNADGDITIVEYFDYQCPYCRKLEPELRQVVQDDGKVRLVLKDWPILGPVSVIAARMALASKFQDKYIQAHEALIGVNSKLTEPRMRELLAGAGIDVERLDRDLVTNTKAIDAIIARNSDQATAFGFKGTPSFIVGKFRVPGILTMAEFDQVIADARKAKASK